MKYDFDKIIDRKNTGSLKWDIKDGELPMWVADMDFETAPCVKEYLTQRASHGVFGYNIIVDSWYDAYSSWWERRHHFPLKKEALIFTTGVIPAVSCCVRKLTTPAEKVLIQSPVYNIFFNSIINNGRQVLQSPLVYDNQSATWSVNWVDLEQKLSDPQTTLMILCNPHNPIGKIWDKETLQRIGELCKKYAVTVISDEIHCDIVKPGKGYIPFASVSETCRQVSVTCLSPSKSFNIAGLHSAAVYIENQALRNKVDRALNTDEIAEPGTFAIGAATTAFEKGEDWLNELNIYLQENKDIATTFIETNIPNFKVTKSEATYLLWIEVPTNSKELATKIREKSGLYLSNGVQYGESGEHFLRLNVACPRSMLLEGLRRLKEGL